MKILAIETSGAACSVALLMNNQFTQIHKIAPAEQAQLVLSIIDEILQQHHITLKDLDTLAFGCGPGSFTGVRIATSVIQGLSYATELPVIPISSLAALAQTVCADLGWKQIAVAVDARMNEIYWAGYQVNSQGLVELVGKEVLSVPENLILPSEIKWYGAGNGWEVYAEKMPFQPLARDVICLPTAKAVIQLAIPKFERQEWVRAVDVVPVYLRDKVVKS